MDKHQEIPFKVLYEGQQKINQIKEEVILIMGQTRAGKSCLCNHIRLKSMIGEGKSNPRYVPKDKEDPTFAKMGDEGASITLDPNIYMLSSNRNLIDAAGFDENRGTSGVIAVSYFLEALFSQLKKVKFILVFNHHVIFNRNPQNVAGTFDNFLSLFNLQGMDDGLKKKLMKSVSIVITHSSETNNQYCQQLNNISDKLRQKTIDTIKFQKIIVEIIKDIVDGKRINNFKVAKPGVQVSTNSLLPDLEQTNWNFFDCQKSRKMVQGQLIILPFEHDFKRLCDEKKEHFKKALKERSDTVIFGFAKVVKVYRDSLIENWKRGIRNQNTVLSKSLDNVNFFQEVTTFLSWTFSTYKIKGIDQMINFKKPFSSSPKLLDVLQSTLKIYDHFQKVVNNEDPSSIYSLFNIFAKQIPLIIEEMVAICTKQQQYQILKKMTFVMKRFIHQFSTFYKIMKGLLNDLHHKLTGQISSSLDRKYIYIDEICNSIDTKILNNLFTKIPELQHFDKLIEEYMGDLRNNPNPNSHNYYTNNRVKYQSNFQMVKMSIATSKFDISTKDPPLITLSHLVNLLAETFVTVRKLNQLNPSQDTNTKCLLLKMDSINHIQKASDLLLKYDSRDIGIADLAVELSELTRCSFHTQKIYQIIQVSYENNLPILIPQQPERSIPLFGQKLFIYFNRELLLIIYLYLYLYTLNIKEIRVIFLHLISYLEKYAQFLIKWGRIQEAIQKQLKKKHLCLTIKDINEINNIEDKIINYHNNSASIVNQRNNLIRRLKQPLTDKQNEDIQKVLVKISQKFNYLPLNQAVENFKRKRVPH